MIRVCIVEDHTLVREGLQSLLHLSPDIRVVAEASNGRDALKVLREAAPEVLLLDIRMPDMSGMDVLGEMSAQGLDIPTIILTTFDDDSAFFECLKLGVKGYLLKDVSRATLTEAVVTVAAGGLLINPAMTERIVKIIRTRPKTAEGQMERLTERETDILRLMAAGLSNGEIGDALRLAEGTVKNHVSNILGKLNVRDRTRAVLKGITLGFIG